MSTAARTAEWLLTRLTGLNLHVAQLGHSATCSGTARHSYLVVVSASSLQIMFHWSHCLMLQSEYPEEKRKLYTLHGSYAGACPCWLRGHHDPVEPQRTKLSPRLLWHSGFTSNQQNSTADSTWLSSI